MERVVIYTAVGGLALYLIGRKYLQYAQASKDPLVVEMEARLAKADAVAAKLHPFEKRQMAYLESVAGGKALLPKPGPDKGSTMPLQIPKIILDVAGGCATAGAAGLPEAERFPSIPETEANSVERKALAEALRHMVPVGIDWEYNLLVERSGEWEPALKTRRLVTKRYIAEDMYFLKGCHLLTGAGSLDTVLKRLAKGADSDAALDEKLKGWLILKVDLALVKGKFGLPVMAEVLRKNKADGTPDPDWDDTIHPHIFGPLPLGAVTKTAPVVRNTSGKGGKVTIGDFVEFKA